jgi:membrane protease YdiL (CAAX protease family)
MVDDGQHEVERTISLQERTRPIAPWWHTVLVVAQLVTLAVLGPRSMQGRVGMPHVVLYTAALMSTWMQLGVVVAGVYRRRRFFLHTLERRARSWWVEVQRGFALYLGTVLMLVFVTMLLHRAGMRPGFDNHVAMAMAPRSWVELLYWLVVSASVGFCEEHVFRGYLLQQMIRFGEVKGASSLLSSVVAVVLSAVLFGSLHLYEGVGGAVLITCLGVMYAVIALRCGNLRVVIVAHTMQDFLTFLLIMTRHGYRAG